MDDIDLFIAGVSERHAKGALVGPTFQGILADQFQKLKRGDRFFYSHDGQPSSFTSGITNKQLVVIWIYFIDFLVCRTIAADSKD